MEWNVKLSGKAEKQALKLPRKVLDALVALMVNIREAGPVSVEIGPTIPS